MTYDQWRCDPGYDDPPEEDCLHEDYDADVNGCATCGRCGHRWWLSLEEVQRERELHAAYDRMCRREEWRQWREEWLYPLAFWRRWRKPRPAMIDDDIPF